MLNENEISSFPLLKVKVFRRCFVLRTEHTNINSFRDNFRFHLNSIDFANNLISVIRLKFVLVVCLKLAEE